MEKILVILATVLMMLSFSMVGLAYNQNTVGTTGANHQACGPGERYWGDVAWAAPDIHEIMVNGPDGSKIFDVSGVAMKSTPEVGRFVIVNYTVTNGDRLASSVNIAPKRVASLYVGPY